MCSSPAIANRSSSWALQPTLCPEMALVICCAHTQVSRERLGQIQTILHTELDWQVVVYQARKHGVVRCCIAVWQR